MGTSVGLQGRYGGWYESGGGPAVLGLKRPANCEDEASHEHVVSPISSYSFDWIVLIFGYIVERANTKILSSHFLQFPS